MFSYICELRGTSFILPPDQIIPSGQESFAGFMALAQFVYQNPGSPKNA